MITGPVSWMGNLLLFPYPPQAVICWGSVHLFGHTSVTGGLIDDGLLGAVVLVPIQAAVLSSLGVD